MDSRLLVKHRSGTAEGVEELRRTRFGRWLLFHLQHLEKKTGHHLMLHPGSPGVPFEERLRGAHVLHLHDVHSSFVNPAAIARWSRRIPVVWTLQDMWAVTGKCIYAYDCERWTTGCGRCPQLGDWPAVERDRTDFLWRWKRRVFEGARLRLVTPSRWLAGIVARSPLLGRMPVEVIPNSVDTSVFRPGRDDAARRALGIPDDAVVVAFGSHPGVPRKGFRHLVEATALERAERRVVILAMGERLAPDRQEPGIVWAGTVAAGDEMARHLRAADLLALPTLAENLALVLLEAAATGLPAVAFDAGGTREAVRDGTTGIVVPVGDTIALGHAVAALVGDPARRRSMGAAARAVAEREYDAAVVAERYEAAYRRALYPGADG